MCKHIEIAYLLMKTGQWCEHNINECESDPCYGEAECVNGLNKFVCNCPADRTGARCEAVVDGCTSQPCRNGSTCIPNGQQEFKCQCLKGYTGKYLGFCHLIMLR